jgi:glycosyltransferase involved in cell wall biosynthesis
VTQSVLYYTDSQDFGGAERVMLQLFGGLDRRRWRPELAYHPTGRRMPLVEYAAELGVRLHAIPPMPPGVPGLLRTFPFAARLHASPPTIFHAHLTWPLACRNALVAALLAGVPAVIATGHLFVDLPYSRRARIEQRLISRRLSSYIAVSRDAASRLHSVFRVPRAKLRVIHNGVDIAAFARPVDATLRHSLVGGCEWPVAITTARLTHQKGIAYLIDAAAALPQLKVVIVGDGPLRSQLEERARHLNIDQRVNFVGHQADVARWLAAADVFVLPSLYEGMPLSVLEAMAARLPVVATEVGGTNEVVENERTGLLVRASDASALANAIGRVIADAALADRLADAGNARVRREFSVDVMVRQVEELYAELTSGEPGPSGG